MTALAPWQNFYVIVGSASAALTGLMFVSLTIIAGTRARRSGNATNAYSTPTVIHFCVALFISAMLAVPWPHLWQAGIVLGITGLGWLPYLCVVARRIHTQSNYQAVLEDWVWHVILPMLAYVALSLAAIALPLLTALALFLIAGVALLLLFIGIHNAWDTVTYIVMQYGAPSED